MEKETVVVNSDVGSIYHSWFADFAGGIISSGSDYLSAILV